MLRTGIQIKTAFPIEQEQRIWLSDGTIEPQGKVNGLEYDNKSRIPKTPWRNLNSEEIAKLFTNEAFPDYQSNIGIIKLPQDLIDRFVELGVNRFTARADMLALRKSRTLDYMKTMNDFYKFIDTFLLKSEGKTKHDFYFGEKNLATTTLNTQTKKFAGLHIDYWEALNLCKMSSATNRICFNMGLQDRFLLFVNQSLLGLFAMIQEKNPSAKFEDYSQSKLEREFFAHYPDYPVGKLRIKPFEAYIAPTENMIHDGSTLGNSVNDLNLTTRGHFSVVQPQLATQGA